jgi:predicted dehydrogenase
VNKENLKAAAADLGVADGSLYDDYREMLSRESLDAVVVATPHTLHYDQITAALDRDLHVLTEKPMVVDLDRAKELRRRVEGGEQVLMVGFQRHLDTAYRRARARYLTTDGPAIGCVTAEITEDWIDSFTGTWRTTPDLSDGGYVTDTARHVIDAILWITDLEPVAVSADMVFEKPRIERSATIRIEFETGATATVTAYGDAESVREQYHVWDDDGGVRIWGRGWDHREFARVDVSGGEYVPQLDRSSERTKAAAFVDAVVDDAPLPSTPRDAVRATAVIAAAYESADAGGRISVDLK